MKINKSLKRDIFRDNIRKYGSLTCTYCKRTNLNRGGNCKKNEQFNMATIDHKKPLSKGGKNNYRNCVVSCFICNQLKNNKSYKEFVIVISWTYRRHHSFLNILRKRIIIF